MGATKKKEDLVPIHTGIVKNGRFLCDNPDWLACDIESLEGLNISVTYKEVRSGKCGSDPLRKYYHAVLLSTITAHHKKEKLFPNPTKERIHKAICAQFLGVDKYYTLEGTQMEEPISTTTLQTKSEWYDFTMQIHSFVVTEYGFHIPPPRQDYKEYLKSGDIQREDVPALDLEGKIKVIYLMKTTFESFIKCWKAGIKEWDGEMFGPDLNYIESIDQHGEQCFISLSTQQRNKLRSVALDHLTAKKSQKHGTLETA